MAYGIMPARSVSVDAYADVSNAFEVKSNEMVTLKRARENMSDISAMCRTMR